MSNSRLVVVLISIIYVVVFSIYLIRIQLDFSEDIQSKNFIVDKSFYDFINNSIQNESSISSHKYRIKILNSSGLNLDICEDRFFSSIKADLLKTEIAKSILINPSCLTAEGIEIWFDYKTSAEYSNIRSEIFNVFNNLFLVEKLITDHNLSFYFSSSHKYNVLNLNIKNTQQAFFINDLFYKLYQRNRDHIYKHRYIKVLDIPPRNLLLNSFNSKICDVNFSTLNTGMPTVSILSLSGADKLKNCSAVIEDSINAALDDNSKIKVVPYEFIESTKYLTSSVVLILALAGFFLLSVVYFFIRLFRESYLK
jgi:hypothetical protein